VLECGEAGGRVVSWNAGVEEGETFVVLWEGVKRRKEE